MPDDEAAAVDDLLLPVVKGDGSERSFEQLTQALQTLGGVGYLQDHPLEQYLRDAKIDTLYEGTTAIQGLDFSFRKVVRDQGRAFGSVCAEIGKFLSSTAGAGSLDGERQLLGQVLEELQRLVSVLVADVEAAGGQPERLHHVGWSTTRPSLVGRHVHARGGAVSRHGRLLGHRR